MPSKFLEMRQYRHIGQPFFFINKHSSPACQNDKLMGSFVYLFLSFYMISLCMSSIMLYKQQISAESILSM